MQQGREPPSGLEPGLQPADQVLDHHGVLGDREGVRPGRLAVPARHPRQAMGDVVDLDVERGGVQQIEPAAGQHALPRPRLGFLTSVI